MLNLQLNEVNFDFALAYADKYDLNNIKLVASNYTKTSSEAEYEHLEPWVQWVSAHTGLTYSEHDVFRLGDMVNHNHKQIFETVEKMGFTVGAISPMNTKNNLNNPKYFIPDPWTNTETDGSFWSKALKEVLVQTVNDNAQSKVSVKSLLLLACALIRFARVKNYPRYIKYAFKALKKSWFKPLFLDLFLSDLHSSLYKNKKTDFSTLFLNAGAHIQHHYLYNSTCPKPSQKFNNPDWYVKSEDDPFLDVLKLYDYILGEAFKSNDDVLVSTGLTQVPYPEKTYYWRIKEHAKFLNNLNIQHANVFPRMTRDFLIEFDTNGSRDSAKIVLESLCCVKDGVKLFEELDVRDKSIFATLTYPNEVTKAFTVSNGTDTFDLSDSFAFVALKNGMHDQHGFVYAKGVDLTPLKTDNHVKNLYNVILQYFENNKAAESS